MLHIAPTGFVLRPYQQELKDKIDKAWRDGARWVLARLDTGGGKSPLIGAQIRDNIGGVCVVAHRDVLVIQLSMMLAKSGVRHDVICSAKTRRIIIADHMEEFGRSYLDDNSRVKVASVDTIIRRQNLKNWAATVTLFIVDEAHHLVVDNKWHKAAQMFTHPALRGLGVTATPERADGKGLGAHADGLFEVMVQGPPMRWLIDNGFLTDYDIVLAEGDLADIQEAVSATGDWSPATLRKAAKKSRIVGDVVDTYITHAYGKLGVTFATDIETAGLMAAKYNDRGIRAAVLTGDTDPDMRRTILRKFKARELWQIIAVNIISEGFDIPAIEVVSFARPTASLATYMQQFGRALRLMEGKLKALIIDHVGNIKRHKLPDMFRVWTLDGREKRAGSAGATIPQRVCLECAETYRRILDACPYCGCPAPEPQGRGSPQAVDGVMELLDPAVLRELRGELDKINKSIDDYKVELLMKGTKPIHMAGILNKHGAAQAAQQILRETIALWSGHRTVEGLSIKQQQMLFFYRFGVDVLTAQTLRPREASTLADKVAFDFFNPLDEGVMNGL